MEIREHWKASILPASTLDEVSIDAQNRDRYATRPRSFLDSPLTLGNFDYKRLIFRNAEFKAFYGKGASATEKEQHSEEQTTPLTTHDSCFPS
jgi:hypothetical protein